MPPIKPKKAADFEEFWVFYVGEHSTLRNRRMHFMGTLFGLISLTMAAVTANPWFLLLAVVMGYGPAWIGHWFLEKNHPATLTHPLYSLLADFRMFYLTLNGKMDEEIERIQSAPKT